MPLCAKLEAQFVLLRARFSVDDLASLPVGVVSTLLCVWMPHRVAAATT